MKPVSVKMLMLLVALLTFAVVSYGMAGIPSVRAAVTWLDADPNLPPDPNAPATPAPEMALSTGSLLWLSALPADVNEPNQPPQPKPPEKV